MYPTFRLFIAGDTPRSARAVANLRAFCEAAFGEAYVVEVIDVQKNPDLADIDGVLATPMVTRLSPEPPRSVIGDLSDPARLAAALDIAVPGSPCGGVAP